MADGTFHSVNEGRDRTGFGVELDSATLMRARRGDMQAFADIYDRYGKACYNLALRMLGEPAAAADVVQEVFVKLFDRIKGFRGEAPFGAWLKRMAANATIDVLRAARRNGGDDVETMFANLPDADMDAERRADAWTLLMRLPPRARAVVLLHELEGYSHKEIAELFGRSDSCSKSILARALHRLHAASPRSEPEDGHRHD